MRRIKEFFSDGTYLLVIMLAGILIALLVFEQISPSPKEEINPETLNEITTAEHEVVEVQAPAEDLIIGGDDLSQQVQENIDNGYYEALDLLAHLIYSEVGSDGEESMYHAGSVVLNRIKSNEYPNTLEDVIYQKGQYQVTWNGGLYKEEPSDIAYEVAADLLEEGSITPDEVLYQAEFKQGTGVYEKIGNTYYCYK